MKLTAHHRDGFTEHLLRWMLVAENGVAYVTARWFDGAGGATREFNFDFPDNRIDAIADKLRGLKPSYDGMTDDFPDYEISIELPNETIRVHVADSIEWDDQQQTDIDRFMEAWSMIYRDVERALAISGRHTD